MFVPKRFESALPWRELLARHDFGALLTADGEDLFATHVPYLVDAERRTLTTHLARANPHWQAIERQPRCRLIVQGAHGYVSPQWYATKESVPTWDYEVVHVEGTAALEHDPERLWALVRAMAARFEEPAPPGGWTADGISEPFRKPRLASIVGVTLRLEDGVAKQKLSQDRTPAERDRIARELRARGNGALADCVASVDPERD